MLRNKIIIVLALAGILAGGLVATGAAAGKKKTSRFRVRIENVSNAGGLTAADGSKYPFALSPGAYVVTDRRHPIFETGRRASAGLESQAEDGNPETIVKTLSDGGKSTVGAFNTPAGAAAPGPLLPGGVYEYSFEAAEGMKLSFAAMYGQSNDLFYAPVAGIDLFENGTPLAGDITDRLLLWDAGTEVNQAPGIGPDQAPRQKAPNTGAAEKESVRGVVDSFMYPQTKDVLKVTITNE